MTSKPPACNICAISSVSTTFTAGPPTCYQILPRSASTPPTANPAKRWPVSVFHLGDARPGPKPRPNSTAEVHSLALSTSHRGRHHAREKSLPVKDVPHRFHQVLTRSRLRHVSVRPHVHNLSNHFIRVVHGKEHNLGRLPSLFYLLRSIDPAESRQVHIHYHQIRL